MRITTQFFSRRGGYFRRLAQLTCSVLFNMLWLGAHSANAQNIPDANFAQAIREQCPTCIDANNNLLASAKNLNRLAIDNRNIASIEGIAGFTELRILISYNNQLTSLPTMPSRLEIWGLGGNKLQSLPMLPASTILLNVSDNKLTSLPALPSGLLFLDCSKNQQLTNLPTLPAGLRQLSSSYNTNLRTLPSLPESLEVLFCINNGLNTLPKLPVSLEELYCGINNLTSLPTLPPKLVKLNCASNEITSLPTLPSTLETLIIDADKITCLPNLVDGLRVFRGIGDNGLQADPVATLPLCDGTRTVNCLALGDQCSGNASETKSFTLNSTGGNQDLTLIYRASEERPTLRMMINGVLHTTTLPQTLSNLAYNTVAIGNFPLKSGSNTITFASGGGYICFRQLCTSGASTPPPPTPTNCLALGDQCSGNQFETKSYTLNQASAGGRMLKLTYRAQEQPTTLRLMINGTLHTKVLPQTPGDQSYRTMDLGTYALNAGNNAITMATGGGYLCFRELCTDGSATPPPPPPVPVPEACLALGDQCSGNQFEVKSYTLNQASASSKTLTLTYRAIEGAAQLRLMINGMIRTMTLPQTPGDQSYRTMSLGTFALNAGNNSITMATGGGYLCFRQLCTDGDNPAARLSAEAEITAQATPLATYPNPTTGSFEASFYLAPGQRASLNVNDMLGRPIWTKALTGQGQHKEQVRLPEAANGMFILRLQREDARPGQAAELTKVLVVK